MLIAFLLTLVAGAATSVGAAIGLLGRRTSEKFLAGGLGFSAGVMLYISFMELLPTGALVLSGGERVTREGTAIAVGCFFAGIMLIAVVDRLVPQPVNPHEFPPGAMKGTGPGSAPSAEDRRRARLLRTGMVTAIVLAAHNVPEGFATFVAALQSPELAIPVVAAIALHNIPEGIAVAVPILHATGSRVRAMSIASLSGLAEPVGAVFGFLLLMPLIGGPESAGMGGILAAVAGIMVFVSLDELLPAAQEYGEHHVAIYALIAGMGVMALSLLALS